MGGMMKKKGYAMGGSANLKKAGADQEGLKKLPTAVRNKMGYMNEGGDATQESAKQAKMMDRLISKMASEYGMSEEKFKKRLNAIKQKEGPRKTKKPTKAQGAAMSKGANYMPKTRKGYAKGGMAKKGYSKGGAVRKSKRGMGAANRGGGAIMR